MPKAGDGSLFLFASYLVDFWPQMPKLLASPFLPPDREEVVDLGPPQTPAV